MWKPYLKVIAKKAPQAIHVLDRFHIMAKMNKAIEDRTDEESRQDFTPPPGVDFQLVPCRRGHFGGDCRGSEQQSKTDDEKSVRLSDYESH